MVHIMRKSNYQVYANICETSRKTWQFNAILAIEARFSVSRFNKLAKQGTDQTVKWVRNHWESKWKERLHLIHWTWSQHWHDLRDSQLTSRKNGSDRSNSPLLLLWNVLWGNPMSSWTYRNGYPIYCPNRSPAKWMTILIITPRRLGRHTDEQQWPAITKNTSCETIRSPMWYSNLGWSCNQKQLADSGLPTEPKFCRPLAMNESNMPRSSWGC